MSQPAEEQNHGPPPGENARGTMLANISRRTVMLYKEFYGKGPTRARTYYQDDTVLVLLRGGFTRVEETLMREGRMGAVRDQRDAFQAAMHDSFVAIVEQEVGRKVIAFMSTTHQDPDLNAEVFVLEPAGLIGD
jgi:uncharacterized protein YbcI